MAEATHLDLERLLADELDAVLVAGRYRIERVVARGGMATVYAARDLAVGRAVALKILSEDCSAHPLLLARFAREARLNARIQHANVVAVLDFGTSDTGLIYLVMELLEGEDLARTLARVPALAWPRVRTLMLDICAGLAAVHAAGVVHRDLKPANCFKLLRNGREAIQLLDFGIATLVDDPRSERLTLDDQIVGTPEYMSPEQARGERVDPRSDIYAAGLLLGELLTGSLPFRAATSSAMLAAQIYEPAPTLRSLLPPDLLIPAALEPIYARALAKDSRQRFASIEHFAAALRAIDPDAPLLSSSTVERTPGVASPALATNFGGVPKPKRKWSRVAVGLALLLGAVAALAVAFGLTSAAETSANEQATK